MSTKKAVPKEEYSLSAALGWFTDPANYEIKKNGLTPIQSMGSYLAGSAIQTVGDNRA